MGREKTEVKKVEEPPVTDMQEKTDAKTTEPMSPEFVVAASVVLVRCPGCGADLALTSDSHDNLICRFKNCKYKSVIFKRPSVTLEIIPDPAK